jgi:glycosyltransferase involved in cell wall biosynthesis
VSSAPQVVTDDELARGEHGVDAAWYLEVNPDVAAAGMDPVRHYLEFGWREGRDPRPDFSTLAYLALSDDAVRSGQNPLIHHLRSAGDPDRRKGIALDWHLLWDKGVLHPRVGAEPPQQTASWGTPGRRKILFVGHEATRTGAPLILLRLMEEVARLTGAELFLMLERDGPLLDAYRHVADVLVDQRGMLHRLPMRSLLNGLAHPVPDLVICNCAETWRLMQALRRAGAPRIVSLVHERMRPYGEEIARILHASADRVIFPAHAVKAAATQSFPQFDDAQVIPQGLLVDRFGLGDKPAARRAVRHELGLPPEAKIVLGCGVRQARKGLDLFIQLAARVRSQAAAPVHFAWLGGGGPLTEFTYFVEHDTMLLDLGSTLSLIEETPEAERYFLAADAFALTSRDDPFPCVVHEAMACGVPVVGFDRAGGAGEALADGCGIIVPYLDLDAMTHQLCAVLERPADFVEMLRRAERRVRSIYRFSNYARQILAICAELTADEQIAAPKAEAVTAPRR